MPNDSNSTDRSMESFFQRKRELEAAGMGRINASETAILEERIKSWPSDWGDYLRILIYGDFELPDEEMHFDELGITVHPEKLEKTVIGSALTVLSATVEIPGRSIQGLLDATRRINVLLGSLVLIDWGNPSCGWWSWVTHGPSIGLIGKWKTKELNTAINKIVELSSNAEVGRKIASALYWIREPKARNFYERDLLRIYSGYWNAFECLVDAVNLLTPRERPSKSQKKQVIENYISERNGELSPSDILELYRVVDPGFIAKAKHGLQVCFEDQATAYIKECFSGDNSLYQIRNSINHGEVDAENLTELIRIEEKLHRLWMIVWRMFGRLIPFPAPLDSSLTNQ